MTNISTLFTDSDDDTLVVAEYLDDGEGVYYNIRLRQGGVEAALLADLNDLIKLRNTLDDFLYERI